MAACFYDNLNIWAYSSAGRAYGSHPYATSSHGLGSLPIQQSVFPDFPLKIEYLKNPFFITFLIEKQSIWARSSAGSAKGSVFCHIYNFILLYSSVPLWELLIWAYSSAGRAYGSHPHGRPSPARFSLPIFRPVFRTIPSKLNISKIHFSQLF